MFTLLIAVGSFVAFIVAYHTYGRWLGARIFGLRAEARMPSEELRDDVDYVPTRPEVVFGHHFTSIAGTGPIVGPAIAMFWGWLPALLWVVFGSIFIGAVHDFGALVVSLRSRGQTVAEAAGAILSRRAVILFVLILLLELTVVLAVFFLVVATIFAIYPESVMSVWVQIPLAVAIGFWVHKFGGRKLLLPSLVALAVMYLFIWVGTHYPVQLDVLLGLRGDESPWLRPLVIWTGVLLVYVFIASVLPVWSLLQPRDYINSWELFLAMGVLVVGLAVAGVTGQADIDAAPAYASAGEIPAGAPPMLPFLFIIIACGAVSGFHALVSSGTSSKQLAAEPQARLVGYGSMLLEGALAILVILACTAGLGMGALKKTTAADGAAYAWRERPVAVSAGQTPQRAAWRTKYDYRRSFADHKLAMKLGAFVEGGANFLKTIGLPFTLGIGLLAVLVASFASTTLDTATRLQRYVIQELATTLRAKPLANRYVATGVAVAMGGALALLTGNVPGTGGLILWPVFGAINQLLAGMVFIVLVCYLKKTARPFWFAIVPMILMIVLPAWAMLHQMFAPSTGWLTRPQPDYLLGLIGAGSQVLLVWLIVEGVLAWRRIDRGQSGGTVEAAEAHEAFEP